MTTVAQVPQGAWFGTVRPLALEVRTLLEFDMDYLQDYLRSEVMIDGRPSGSYARTLIPDGAAETREGFLAHVEAKRADNERRAIEAFVDKYGFAVADHGQALNEYGQRLSDLEEYAHRIRWWHLRRRYAAWKRTR